MRSTRSPKSKLARWALLPVGIAVAVILAGCTSAQQIGFLPEGSVEATNHTSRITGLWTTSWIVLLVVGIVTWALIIWAAIVYRRRKGQTGFPVQLRYNLPVEIFYTIVPFILVIGFFAFTARDQAEIEKPTANPDVTIEVFGKRWSWDFNYLNDPSDPSDDRYTSGIQGQEKDGEFVDVDGLPVLYLPVDKSVEIRIESRDVIHSFWIVDFLYKKDMVPARTNYMFFTPTKEGEYAGKCAELCGEYHSQMLFTVKVVSQAEYDRIMNDDSITTEGRLDSTYNVNQNLPGTGASSEGDHE